MLWLVGYCLNFVSCQHIYNLQIQNSKLYMHGRLLQLSYFFSCLWMYLCIAASAKVNYEYVCGWTKETQLPILSCVHEKTLHGLLSTSDHMTCKW